MATATENSMKPPIVEERIGRDARGNYQAVGIRLANSEEIHIHAWEAGGARACVGNDITLAATADTPLDAIRLAIETYRTVEKTIS